MKKIFVIPGFRHSIKDKSYLDLKKILEKKNLEVKLIDIKWNYRHFNNWLDQFLEIYNKNKGKENIILGFSFGAVIAFISSIKLQPKLSILCSMSPSFKEDLKSYPKSWVKATGKKNFSDFQKLEFVKFVKKIKNKIILLIGEKEAKKYPLLLKRVETAHDKIKNSSLIWVKNAKHDIGQKEYLKVIQRIEF